MLEVINVDLQQSLINETKFAPNIIFYIEFYEAITISSYVYVFFCDMLLGVLNYSIINKLDIYFIIEWNYYINYIAFVVSVKKSTRSGSLNLSDKI
ncbi:hypothetical protein, partial [Clostridium saccharoperbutylacetonicum]|uniref:hypothetical protein n=1 Tax=Clostridium saccharoperbutylacetonicum TaxID=36745 RepID=UPI0039E85D06